MVRAKKLFCQKYTFFLFRHCISENIDDISRNVFTYSFVIAFCCNEIEAINDL